MYRVCRHVHVHDGMTNQWIHIICLYMYMYIKSGTKVQIFELSFIWQVFEAKAERGK